MITETGARDFVQAAIDESVASFGGQFREVCLGIEFALAELKEKGTPVIGMTIVPSETRKLVIESCEVADFVPDDYHIEGFGAVIYTIFIPRQIIMEVDPLRATRVVVGHNTPPTVTYDDCTDALPLMMNRPLDREKLMPKAAV